MKKLFRKWWTALMMWYQKNHKDRVRFYRHPEDKYIFVMYPGKFASDKTFRVIYPQYIEISMAEFDQLLIRGIQMVEFEDDKGNEQTQTTYLNGTKEERIQQAIKKLKENEIAENNSRSKNNGNTGPDKN